MPRFEERAALAIAREGQRGSRSVAIPGDLHGCRAGRAGRRGPCDGEGPTTHDSLSRGIGEAVALDGVGDSIERVSVSTTLATNAVVEGQGQRVALLRIGADRAGPGRGGLVEALGRDRAAFIAGGHEGRGGAR